jgi:hypothetical protein
MLLELRIEQKLLAITADNVSNNDTLISELYFTLTKTLNPEDPSPTEKETLRFQGIDS